jgi:diguanylate cyclase (GGDEF)-like protein/PAS domain S-box-containing protein
MALRTPTAVLGLMAGARVLVKSQTGMPAPWAAPPYDALPHAMFRHALATSRPFVIDDIKRHPLTKDMVIGVGWDHAAYCGVPIVLSNRKVVGVLAVFDPKPRPWTDREIGFLQDLADSAVREIEEMVSPPPAPQIVPDERLETLARGPDGFIAVDALRRIVLVNSAAEKLLRCASKDVVGTTLLTAFPALEGTTFETELERAFGEENDVAFEEYCGSARAWLEVRAFLAFDHLVIQLRDVSARRESEEALRHSEARYRGVFQDALDPIVFLTAEGSFTECNRAAMTVFGYTRDELFRIRLIDLFADQQERDRFMSDLEHFGGLSEFEAQLVAKGGSRLECAITVSARRSADGGLNGYHAMIEDRTERNRSAQQLRHGAFHDVLTALPNRALFMDRLERVVVQSKRRSTYRFAVLFVDVDRFKLVNDTLGHMAGDELLVAVARRLERCLRAEDTVARFGGDEFAILLDSIQDVRDATRIAERINFELALPFRVGRREVACSASIGIALSATGYDRGEDVLRDADAAMYRAKAGGRARYEVFDTEMHARALAQLQLEKDLRKAVEEEEFAVFYQPVVSLDAGTITGIEALLRWRHPQRGLLLPEEFIEMAEQTGLIVPIGWSVMREACRQMSAWLDVLPRPNSDLTLGINLSARQFQQPDLVPRIQEILEETRLNPVHLRLELTEQVVMGDPDLAAAMLGELQERGVRISIDDFGTGYSSIRHLQRLPVSALKIDRSFIAGLTGDGDSALRGVVQTIVALSESLAIDAIAEGVETLEQLQELRTLGARYAQGFLFSEPMEAEAATQLMLDRTA